MNLILLGLGSNVLPAENLRSGLVELEGLFGSLEMSPVYEGAAIGFQGSPFWNLVIAAATELTVGDLQRALRNIEYAHGRAANATRFSDRSLDIDILTVGDRVGVIDNVTLPRGEILERAFVLRPLADLRPEGIHPIAKKTYAELWAAYDADREPLREVSLT